MQVGIKDWSLCCIELIEIEKEGRDGGNDKIKRMNFFSNYNEVTGLVTYKL
jgi:hypothetical protein